jgi:hypothetical protein
MSRIHVVDQECRAVMPCTPARARMVLVNRKAAILRRFPLVLILTAVHGEAAGSVERVAHGRGGISTSPRSRAW